MNLTLADRVRGWLSPEYAARAALLRQVADTPSLSAEWSWVRQGGTGGRRGAEQTRFGSGWTQQPFGPGQTRTLTPEARRSMVRRSRAIYENNVLGRSFVDRCTDNIIGEGMSVQASTEDAAWNQQAESLWKEYGATIDGAGRHLSHGDWQRAAYTAYARDGDVGGILLRSGAVQLIESDYVRSPSGAGDMATRRSREGEPDIVDGVELSGTGRPRSFHIASYSSASSYDTTSIRARDFVWAFDNDRLDRTAVRGVPKLATIGPLLDQIDGTVEAVTLAYRMAAMFGLVIEKAAPASGFAGLPNTATGDQGQAAKGFGLQPAMVEYTRSGDKIHQVKPEHPTSQFDGFMSFCIRLAGLEFGLPLELAMLDFSKTNYSSARASMEQAYRSFRVRRNRFATAILTPIYRWKVSRWMNEGSLSRRDDAWSHRWLGQPWPYLDPQKEVVASMVAIDGGMSTLADELMKRGYDFDEFIQKRAEEIRRLGDAGLEFAKSNLTRDEGQAIETSNEDED